MKILGWNSGNIFIKNDKKQMKIHRKKKKEIRQISQKKKKNRNDRIGKFLSQKVRISYQNSNQKAHCFPSKNVEC